MRTLVIHPDDRTTDFLKVIYEGRDWTVYNSWRPSVKEILKLIRAHDRVIAMGHGGAYGLIGFSHVFMNEKVIRALRKKDCVCIWCHANIYVERVGIRGFYTGMFISEVGEANYWGIHTTQEKVTYSNELFSNIVKGYVDSPKILTEVKSLYTGDCPVIQYNNERLYYRSTNQPIEKVKTLIY